MSNNIATQAAAEKCLQWMQPTVHLIIAITCLWCWFKSSMHLSVSLCAFSLGLSVIMCFVITVNCLLTDSSIGRTPLWNGHLDLVPLFIYWPFIWLYKMDTLCQSQRCPSYSFWASSPGHSGSGARNRRRACNFISGILNSTSNSPVALHWLSCQISANQHEAAKN